MSEYKGEQISSEKIRAGLSVTDLVNRHFNAYNAARLQQICKLAAKIVQEEETVVGWTLSGAMTPAGLGSTSIVPLIENGWVDYLVTTGANLYHDIHFALDLPMHKSSHLVNDRELRKQKLIRIYDIVFDLEVLLQSDQYMYRIIREPEFQKRMGSSEFHYLLGRYVAETERELGTASKTILSTAHKYGVPLYTPAFGDSTIGLNAAAAVFAGNKFDFDAIYDVNESAALAYHAKKNGKSAAVIFGGGTPKNFILQTIPLLDEIMKIDVLGHDYFIQVTDARADTGGLSGATPGEAVTWGKVDPAMLPRSIVAYVDSTIALPIVTAYLLENCKPRTHRRFYDRRQDFVDNMAREILREKVAR
jgi:deoxyhypusine synthase